MHLDYRFHARLTDSIQIGPVGGGIRVDNDFDGSVDMASGTIDVAGRAVSPTGRRRPDTVVA